MFVPYVLDLKKNGQKLWSNRISKISKWPVPPKKTFEKLKNNILKEGDFHKLSNEPKKEGDR